VEVFLLHRTIKWIIAAALILSLCAASFAVAEESYYLELPSKGIASSRQISVNIPQENPVVDGINPLTGEVWGGECLPIGVNIDQHPEALPNWGVASADIIFEMPIQADGSTRAFALFMSDIPSYAGPVRSGRVPMASLREIFGGAWVFYGWQNTVVAAGELIVDVDSWALNMHEDARQGGRWVFPYIEGTERNYANLFHREKDGMHVAPYNVQIDMKDCRFDVFRASGNGGQCVNTTDSAVRLTHIPTGIVISCQDEKSQLKNKDKALKVLRAKLYALEMMKAHEAQAEERRSQIGTGDRSEKIRTYNFPQGRVTDHRIGLTLYKLDKILNGDIQEIIDACTAADQAARLARIQEAG
jgi:hypothetical protein